MFTKMRRLLRRFFTKSRTINNEPINKVSLIVVIIIDIFVLINVFSGLDDISIWYIDPSQAYPCYSEWDNYWEKNFQDRDYEAIRSSLQEQVKFRQEYKRSEQNHLGKVSEICLNYGNYKDKINSHENQQILKTIEQKQEQINTLEQANSDIRNQYESTLLEKIAGQPRNRSINLVAAEKAKQELDENNRNIATFEQEIANLKKQLLSKPESLAFLTLLKDKEVFASLKKGYEQASFWYPSIQITFQFLFLLPLIVISLSIHKFAQRRGYGVISLMSWHLLVISFVPLLIKIFEFLQVGAIFQFFFDIISLLLGQLLFLISYVYILLIPLIGFGIIKFVQKIVFNPKIQAAQRVQKLRCIKCAKKIRPQDTHCPHCGYYQYVECSNCHNLTYKNLPYCKECGSSQS